jgi:hypothetical protein
MNKKLVLLNESRMRPTEERSNLFAIRLLRCARNDGSKARYIIRIKKRFLIIYHSGKRSLIVCLGFYHDGKRSFQAQNCVYHHVQRSFLTFWSIYHRVQRSFLAFWSLYHSGNFVER